MPKRPLLHRFNIRGHATILGIFAPLPQAVRLRIWEYCLVPDRPTSVPGHRRRLLSLLATCHHIYGEAYSLLYDHLSLKFTIGIPYCIVELPVPPSGIEIDDGRGAPFAFIPSNGPRATVAEDAKARWHKVLSADCVHSINFVIRAERAADVSHFLRLWFESMQLADFIESTVPPSRYCQISFHTNERHVGNHQYDRTLGALPYRMPDQMAELIRTRPVGLLMYPFLILYFQRTTHIRVRFIGPQWYMTFDPQSDPGRLSGHMHSVVVKAYQERETVVSLWLYQKAIHIQGKIADLWRLDMFANWHHCCIDLLKFVSLAPTITNLAVEELGFLKASMDTVGRLYHCMRAHNPMSYWQKFDKPCPQFCCGGDGPRRTCDDWSKDEWYKRYPFGIESVDRPIHQYILRKYGDGQLMVSLNNCGMVVTNQTHPLVSSETKTVQDLDSVLYLADEYAPSSS